MSRRKEPCFRESLRILSFRQYSVAEVRDKLIKKGFDRESIDDSIRKLREYKYLDDEELTRTLIQIKFCSAGYGRRKIREYLKRRKIPEDIIGEEVSTAVSRENSIKRGVELIRAKQARRKNNILDNRRRLLGYLAGRGFDLDECVGIISEYENNVRPGNDGKGS